MRNKLSLGAGLLLVGLLLLLGAVATRAAQFTNTAIFNSGTFSRDFSTFQSDIFTAKFSRSNQFDGSFTKDFTESSFGFSDFTG